MCEALRGMPGPRTLVAASSPLLHQPAFHQVARPSVGPFPVTPDDHRSLRRIYPSSYSNVPFTSACRK